MDYNYLSNQESKRVKMIKMAKPEEIKRTSSETSVEPPLPYTIEYYIKRSEKTHPKYMVLVEKLKIHRSDLLSRKKDTDQINYIIELLTDGYRGDKEHIIDMVKNIGISL